MKERSTSCHLQGEHCIIEELLSNDHVRCLLVLPEEKNEKQQLGFSEFDLLETHQIYMKDEDY